MSEPHAEVREAHTLVRLSETDSTNAEAMRRALAGASGPLWIVADSQTAGRGRSGRQWISPPGNLHASCLRACTAPLAVAGQLSLVAGLAVYDAICAAAAGRKVDGLRLKWPNDILIGAAKIGGILVESTTRPTEPGFIAVVGIGINLVGHPHDLDRPATDLMSHGHAIAVETLVDHLAAALDAWITRWNDGEGFADVRAAWLERAGAFGEPLTIHASGRLVDGSYFGIDDTGALLLSDDAGRVTRFSFGDVLLGNVGAKNASVTRDGK